MEELRKAYRIAVIIGLAMMASLLAFTVIVGLLDQGIVPRPSGDPAAGSRIELVKFLLLGASALLFFLARFLTNRILYPEEAQQDSPGRRVPADANARPGIGRLTTAAVVTYACCETPAVFGLVLFLLGGNSADFSLFLIISLFFFASHFPRFSQWEEWYVRQGGRPMS